MLEPPDDAHAINSSEGANGISRFIENVVSRHQWTMSAIAPIRKTEQIPSSPRRLRASRFLEHRFGPRDFPAIQRRLKSRKSH